MHLDMALCEEESVCRSRGAKATPCARVVSHWCEVLGQMQLTRSYPCIRDSAINFDVRAYGSQGQLAARGQQIVA